MELFVFSKKEDQKLEAIGGEFVQAIVSWEETDWYWSKYHENFEVLGHTKKSKNGFKFNEGRVALYQPEKGKVMLFNKYDKETEMEVTKEEFFSDPETYIELIDSEKGKEKFKEEQEYLEKRRKEAEEKAKELQTLAEKLNEAIKKKGGFKFKDSFYGIEYTIEYVTAVGSAYVEATVWNGGYAYGHKSCYNSLLSQVADKTKEYKSKEELIEAILK
jgi:hypothetical protein